MCFVFWGRQSDWWAYGEHGAVAQLTASDMTHRTGPGGDEWRVPHSSQCVYSLPVCFFVFLFVFSFLLELIRLNESGLLLLPSSSASSAPSYFICFTLQPSLAPHPPPAPSRCVNQYSLLTHDSPHMFSTAQGLHLGAEIVRMRVCVFTWVSATLMCLLSYSLSLFLCVCTRVCACVCAWKSTRLARAFSKGLLLSAQINLLSPWVNTLIHLCIWVHVVCACACVCKHANPGEGPA